MFQIKSLPKIFYLFQKPTEIVGQKLSLTAPSGLNFLCNLLKYKILYNNFFSLNLQKIIIKLEESRLRYFFSSAKVKQYSRKKVQTLCNYTSIVSNHQLVEIQLDLGQLHLQRILCILCKMISAQIWIWVLLSMSTAVS